MKIYDCPSTENGLVARAQAFNVEFGSNSRKEHLTFYSLYYMGHYCDNHSCERSANKMRANHAIARWTQP